MSIKGIKVPDIGDFDKVEVIEILVKNGDSVAKDDSIVTLESDKASMEIPAPISGVIKELKIKLGDKIAEGDLILLLEVQDDEVSKVITKSTTNVVKNTSTSANISIMKVPDIGDFDKVEVIEILVKDGDSVTKDDSVITLESDKAAMEIPATVSGVIKSMRVVVGDKIGEGDIILEIISSDNNIATNNIPPIEEKTKEIVEITIVEEEAVEEEIITPATNDTIEILDHSHTHASPSTRKLARELGVDLFKVHGSGNKSRITEDDIKKFVKNIVQNKVSATGSGIPAIPAIDFTKFGEIEEINLSRIQKISGKHLHSCWLNIPHVTQFDEANIDELETFRKIQKSKGVKLTPVVFIIKAVVKCLELYPIFNSSLAKDKLILKNILI